MSTFFSLNCGGLDGTMVCMYQRDQGDGGVSTSALSYLRLPIATTEGRGGLAADPSYSIPYLSYAFLISSSYEYASDSGLGVPRFHSA